MISELFSIYQNRFNTTADRHYLGVYLEVYYDLPLIGGFSLKWEYISGQQPGIKSSSNFYNPGRPSKEPVYFHNFMEYYLTWVYDLGSQNRYI